jgi:hypothetical protein
MPEQFEAKEFHDPALKEAVRRCWACDCASAELHRKVSNVLLQSQSAGMSRGNARSVSSEKATMTIWSTVISTVVISTVRNPWIAWPGLIAACVLLALVPFYDTHRHGSGAGRNSVALVIPAALQGQLIARHDECSKSPNHQHLPVSKDDDAGIASALRGDLHRPVLVARPTGSAWIFRGAAVCPVGSTPAGHLVFVRGEDALSIISAPRSMLPGAAEGSQFAVNVDQHCIVGTVKDGALFFLVASGPPGTVSVDQLKQMESTMLPQVTGIYPPSPQSQPRSPVVLAELLQPTR